MSIVLKRDEMGLVKKFDRMDGIFNGLINPINNGIDAINSIISDEMYELTLSEKEKVEVNDRLAKLNDIKDLLK